MGIDISANVPKSFNPSSIDRYEKVISFGCLASAAFPRPELLDEWPIKDPFDKDINSFRQVRNEIMKRLRALVDKVDCD